MHAIYVGDCETTGLDLVDHDVIELSLLRLSTNEQKTWHIKPSNFQTIDAGALRVNGHLLEDITHKTKHGKDTYLEASKVIVDIENWLLDDNVSTLDRVLCRSKCCI